MASGPAAGSSRGVVVSADRALASTLVYRTASLRRTTLTRCFARNGRRWTAARTVFYRSFYRISTVRNDERRTS